MSLSKIIKLSWLICLVGIGLSPAYLSAQDEEGEEPEQLRTRASLSSVQKNNDAISLNMLLRARLTTATPGCRD